MGHRLMQGIIPRGVSSQLGEKEGLHPLFRKCRYKHSSTRTEDHYIRIHGIPC